MEELDGRLAGSGLVVEEPGLVGEVAGLVLEVPAYLVAELMCKRFRGSADYRGIRGHLRRCR